MDVFCGYALERYFYWKFIETTSYTRMGGWWDRKGENEIDLVCDDEIAGKIAFYEVKIDPDRVDMKLLKSKTKKFFEKNPKLLGRKVTYHALSVEDM